MKISLFIATLAILSIFPVVHMGKKYFDGTVTVNSYNKGLAYDKARDILADYDIVWGDMLCHDSICTGRLSITPAIDQDSLAVTISRPVGKDLVISANEDEGGWLVEFRQDGDGFYSRRIEFSAGGVPVDTTDMISLYDN